jgi:hypothetical protein
MKRNCLSDFVVLHQFSNFIHGLGENLCGGKPTYPFHFSLLFSTVPRCIEIMPLYFSDQRLKDTRMYRIRVSWFETHQQCLILAPLTGVSGNISQRWLSTKFGVRKKAKDEETEQGFVLARLMVKGPIFEAY